MTHNQTKILLRIVIGLSLIFIIYCLVLFMIQTSKKSEDNKRNISENIQTDTVKSALPEHKKYMLRCIDNKVYSVEIEDGGTISNIEKTDININYMREVDKKSLLDGIYVNTKGELLSLIEDFSS